jgi:hypothetical protein
MAYLLGKHANGWARFVTRTAFVPLLAGALLLAPGCAAIHGTARNLQVTNRPGYFELHWQHLETRSTSLVYEWSSAGSSIAMQQTSRIEGGIARVEIHDASGSLVHSEDLRESSSLSTFSGEMGVWRVSLRLNRVSGTIGFRLQGS